MVRTQRPAPRKRILPVLFSLLIASAILAAPAAAQQGPSAILTVDTPYAGERAPIGQPVYIGGWAVDPAGQGTGVDRVEVYLDGAAGAGGVPLGIARYGTARPDVASTYRRPEWIYSGFTMDWYPSRRVAPGDHTLYIYALTATGLSTPQAVTINVSVEYSPRCTFVLPCLLHKDSFAWEIDTGGPGTWFDRFGPRGIF